MSGLPVPRAHLPAGTTCVLTAGGSAPDAIEVAQIERFRSFLRLAKEIGQEAAHAAVYGDDPTTTTGA